MTPLEAARDAVRREDSIRARHEAGESMRAIAAAVGCGVGTVHRTLAKRCTDCGVRRQEIGSWCAACYEAHPCVDGTGFEHYREAS